MFSFFKEDGFERFKQDIKKYCETMKYHDMELTNEEFEQLSWHVKNTYVTPEARKENILTTLPFEVERALARRYSFELLLRGDNFSYEEFIKGQGKNPLSFENFQALSKEAKLLDVDIQTVIRMSCLLTVSDTARESILEKTGRSLSKDSEEFLTEVASCLIEIEENKNLLPLTRNLTTSQVQLVQKIYWQNMHLRHLVCTEGGHNMVKTFSDGVNARSFQERDLIAWKWRWLTNFFGFQGGPGAKYYDEETHNLTAMVIVELEKVLSDPSHIFLESYLLKQAEKAGFDKEEVHISNAEKIFLGHLIAYIAYYHRIDIYDGYNQSLHDAYTNFKREFPQMASVAEQYEKSFQDLTALTPTYTPGVLNNAYLIFKDKFGLNDKEALKNAVQFICQFLFYLYTSGFDKRISCMNLAKETTLQSILEKWYVNHRSVQFKVNENFEMVGDIFLYYNVALVPKNLKQSFIDLSDQFKNGSNYVLDENNSHPHITLIQFRVPNGYDIDELWKEILIIQEKLSIAELTIHLNDTKSKLEGEFAWLQLQIEPHPVCYQLHQELVELIKEHGLPCLNASLEKYDPHLTLAHTTDLSLAKELEAKKIDTNDEFYLVLGQSGTNWQLAEILKTSNVEICSMRQRVGYY